MAKDNVDNTPRIWECAGDMPKINSCATREQEVKAN